MKDILNKIPKFPVIFNSRNITDNAYGHTVLDSVKYKFTKNGNLKHFVYAACYLDFIYYYKTNYYNNVKIKCDVYLEYCYKNHLPLEIGDQWISLFKKHNLISNKVQLTNKGLSFDQDCGNIYQIFNTLYCFRWLDSNKPFVWDVVHLVNNNVNFFQALCYGLSKHISNTNHSIAELHAGQKQVSLWYIVALKIFCCTILSTKKQGSSYYVLEDIKNSFPGIMVHRDEFLNPKYECLLEVVDKHLNKPDYIKLINSECRGLIEKIHKN